MGLCGFEPKDEEERGRLQAECQLLGLDPRERAQELAARDETAKKSTKRVLAALTEGDWDRQAECWQTTSLETLKTRGAHNGLVDYLSEVDAILAPLIAGPPGGS